LQRWFMAISTEEAVECDYDHSQQPTGLERLASTYEGCWGWGFEARCCKVIVRLQGRKDQAPASPLQLPLPKSRPCRSCLLAHRPAEDGRKSRPGMKPRPPEPGLLRWECQPHCPLALAQLLPRGRRWILWRAREPAGVRRRLRVRWSRTGHGTWQSRRAWLVVAEWHWQRCHWRSSRTHLSVASERKRPRSPQRRNLQPPRVHAAASHSRCRGWWWWVAWAYFWSLEAFPWASGCPRQDETRFPARPFLSYVRLSLRCYHCAGPRQKWRPLASPELPLLAPRPCTHTRFSSPLSSFIGDPPLLCLPLPFPSLSFFSLSWILSLSPVSSPVGVNCATRKRIKTPFLVTCVALAQEGGGPAGRRGPLSARVRSSCVRTRRPVGVLAAFYSTYT